MNTKITLLALAVAATTSCAFLNARRDPFEVFERLWGSEFPTMMVLPNIASSNVPAVETEHEYIYEYEIPGRSNEQVQVEVDATTRMLHITIEGRSSQQSEQNNEGVITRSQSSSSRHMEEAFRLPEKADLAKVSWNTQNGVLQIRVGKRGNAESPTRRIVPPSRSMTNAQENSEEA